MGKVSRMYKELFLAFLFLTLGGTLYTTDNYAFMLPLSLGVSCLLFWHLFFKNARYNKVLNLNDNLINLLFIFFLIISLLLKPSDRSLINVIGLVIFLITSVYVLSNLLVDTHTKLRFIVKSSLIVVVPIVFIPFFTGGVNFSRFLIYGYTGIFYNPNALGGVMATFITVIISAFFGKLEVKQMSIKTRLFYITLIILSLIVLFLTRSRTSIVSVLAITVFLLLNFFKRGKIKLNQAIWLIIIGMGVFLWALETDFLYNFFLSKFEKKVGDNNITSNRTIMWGTIIENANFFGHGADYHDDLNLIHAAHSTYFSILAQFGFVNLTLYILLLYRIIKRSWKFMKEATIEYKFVPICVTTVFLTTSFMEGMLMKYSMLIVFLCYGCILNYHSFTSSQNKLK